MRPASRSALYLLTLFLLTSALATLPAAAQEGALDSAPPKGTTPEEIIKRFAEREKLFKEARDHYTYRQDIKVETRDGDTVTGQYHEVFDVLYDDKGHRIENVVFAPQSTLEQGGLSLDQGDVQDFRNRLPFVLTTEEVPEYNILYIGQQQEDELHCYVFDIAPKQIVGKKRYFQGRIWVDDKDFQIVKTYGQAVPEIRDTKKKGKEEHLYPKFTTWREQIDNQYWFPTYTRADDTLHFNTGDIHIREIVKYEDYRRFGSSVKILYQGQEVPKGTPQDQKAPQTPDQNPDQKKPDSPPNPNPQSPQK
ncbi:MAG: hypothetical protein ABSF72_11705 [Candidatus Sulfotelmatobacter sp.]|jgi:hypothetical protein